MKKIIIGAIALCSLLFPACDLLDLKPTDIYGIDNFWENKNQVDRFMSGLHNRVRMRQMALIQLGELRGGYLSPGPMSTTGQGMHDLDIVGHQLSSSNPGVSNFLAFYTDIMQINHAIEQINTKADFLVEQEKNDYLGMLHGMRAFYYFHLFRSWGGMPLVDRAEVLDKFETIDQLNKKRSTERETYQFIRNDIDRSLLYYRNNNFTVNPSYKASFWSKQASYMLKAEINLWGAKVTPIGEASVYSADPTADLTEAKTLLSEIEGKTTLVNNLADLYQKKDNSEMIYSIRYALNESENPFKSFLYPPESFGTEWFKEPNQMGGNHSSDPLGVAGSGASSRYEYKYELYQKYRLDGSVASPNKTSDLRRDYFFMYFGKNIYKPGRPPVLIGKINAVAMCKYLGNVKEGNIRKYTDDFPIYRKADLLLITAEIANELGQTSEVERCVKAVRDRAYFGTTDPAPFVYQNKEQAEEDILAERDREFVCEGKRWYDIRRMLNAKYALELSKGIPGRMLWPISQGDLSKDPLLEQNPAYK